jgi:hypothetical protein
MKQQQVITRYQAMRKIVAAKGAIVGATFTKTDGSQRVMAFRRKSKWGVKGNDASDVAKTARITRKRKHPHLLSILEFRKGKPQWRSLNLQTVSRLRIAGETFAVQ